MKKIKLLNFFLILYWSVYANRTIVTTASAINNGSWSAGDTLVMKNGTWTNQSILFKAIGTFDQPVVLMAETPGSVILNGTSKLGFSGKYVVVSGLYFWNGTLSGSDVVSFRFSSTDLAEDCRLTNTTIENYNPGLNTVDSKWVSLYGKNNQVDHCSFVNKNNSGTLMVVWLISGVTVYHNILDNYFGYRNSNLDSVGNELNGQEIIRIGDSSTSMTTASVTVKGNFFEHCNGEIEVISNKSCGNLFTNNLFYECKGMLTLRHGNGCTVEGNYFFGNGISDTGGVRIISEDHKVYNNYFEKLCGTNYRSAICLVRGKENSALNEYYQVKNATVEFNTMVDCSQAFSVNYNSSSTLTLPPIGTIIAHNQVYNTSGTYSNINISQINADAMDVNWKNNLMNQGKYTNFSFDSTQVITGKDAKMALAGTTLNMLEPGSGSALADYSTTENQVVLTDIRGRNRGNAKLPGASQLSGIVTREMPVKSNVGAGFFNNPPTKLTKISGKINFNAYTVEHLLIVKTDFPGELYIYDYTGKIVFQNPLTVGTYKVDLSEKGIYILVFNPIIGNKFIQKILLN